MLAESTLHEGQAPRHLPLGARVRNGGRAEAPRRESACDASAPRDGRASVRHIEDAHGCDALPDEADKERGDRDGALRARQEILRLIVELPPKPPPASARGVRWSCGEQRPTGRVRQNTQENGHITPLNGHPDAWNGAGGRHRAPLLRKRQKSANIIVEAHLGNPGLWRL